MVSNRNSMLQDTTKKNRLSMTSSLLTRSEKRALRKTTLAEHQVVEEELRKLRII